MLLTKQIGPWYTIRPIRRFCKQCVHDLKGEYINSSHVQAVINRTKTSTSMSSQIGVVERNLSLSENVRLYGTFGRATLSGIWD
jgi:hypothetical protein